ncbi:uncharacterized protein O3C94_016096 [Discoglossus pictus]
MVLDARATYFAYHSCKFLGFVLLRHVAVHTNFQSFLETYTFFTIIMNPTCFYVLHDATTPCSCPECPYIASFLNLCLPCSCSSTTTTPTPTTTPATTPMATTPCPCSCSQFLLSLCQRPSYCGPCSTTTTNPTTTATPTTTTTPAITTFSTTAVSTTTMVTTPCPCSCTQFLLNLCLRPPYCGPCSPTTTNPTTTATPTTTTTPAITTFPTTAVSTTTMVTTPCPCSCTQFLLNLCLRPPYCGPCSSENLLFIYLLNLPKHAMHCLPVIKSSYSMNWQLL